MINPSSRIVNGLLIGLLCFAIGTSAYFVLRYDGLWNEGDTARQVQVLAYVSSKGKLSTDEPGAVYPHGPNYPLLSTVLMKITGVSAQVLTIHVYPLMIFLMVVVGFAVYRTLTNSLKAGLLATLFLYIQPDFLWVILRGSHEKGTTGEAFSSVPGICLLAHRLFIQTFWLS